MNPRWSPGIGDPSVIGWVTVALYLIAAAICAAVASRERRQARDGWRFWAGVALAMLALGINKQLDLQSLFTQVMRDMSLRLGWFAERHVLQLAFILAVAAGGLILAMIAMRRLPVLQRNMRLAALGVCLVYTYVIIRAASFHHIDRFINSAILGARWNWVLEIGGIGIVAVGALRVLLARDRARV
ncbi:multisubunit Na+/H+ antiporter MnhB subunit [Sphingomonas endophytica]|uniref:Multisubunit Na+/H+ antiporter MnhB subunit n=2 Tax=Sphingomonas endophytica TaxID=869719 RepID=A0A7X0MQ37_9SPHN|nr:multisubunit Na+/H+ antiporter MnhB subunit [Sphingomonas endophytica]